MCDIFITFNYSPIKADKRDAKLSNSNRHSDEWKREKRSLVNIWARAAAFIFHSNISPLSSCFYLFCCLFSMLCESWLHDASMGCVERKLIDETKRSEARMKFSRWIFPINWFSLLDHNPRRRTGSTRREMTHVPRSKLLFLSWYLFMKIMKMINLLSMLSWRDDGDVHPSSHRFVCGVKYDESKMVQNMTETQLRSKVYVKHRAYDHNSCDDIRKWDNLIR